MIWCTKCGSEPTPKDDLNKIKGCEDLHTKGLVWLEPTTVRDNINRLVQELRKTGRLQPLKK